MKFKQGSVAEEEHRIKERIEELKAAHAAENANFDATPLKRER